MTHIVLHKAIKRSILGYLMLCWLLGVSGTIQVAASAKQSEAQESYDYTLRHYPDKVHPIDDKSYLHIEGVPSALAKIIKAIPTDTHPHAQLPQLLALVTHDLTTQLYGKYLFASNGLLQESTAQQKARQLNYHLISSPPSPVLWQVLSFLAQHPNLVVIQFVLPKNAPLCQPCAHICKHLFGQELPVHETGCQGHLWPKRPCSTGATKAFNGLRFSDKQRQCTLAAVGDGIFTPKASLKSAQLSHEQDESTHKLYTSPQVPSLTMAHITSYGNQNDPRVPHKRTTSTLPPLGQLLIPANGHALYTTVIMGYLLPVRQETTKLIARIDQLFGSQPAYYVNKLHQIMNNPTNSFTYLHSDAFGTLVAVFMARMQIKQGTWGGLQEIQTIANKLNVNIQVYSPDPNKPTNLVPSDLTEPMQDEGALTLHIVQDKAHPSEVIPQGKKASAADEDKAHYQHYRLKCNLSFSIPALFLPIRQPSISRYIKSKENNQSYLIAWFEAARQGNSHWLATLYHNYKINVDERNEDNDTALLLSARKGHLLCVKFLHQQGADIHDKDQDGETALMCSAQEGHLACVKYLVQQGDINMLHDKNRDKNTALMCSAENGQLACLKFLCQQGGNIHDENDYGETALILSSRYGHLDCVKYLMQQGAKINHKNKDKDTALLLSAQKGHIDIVTYLVQQGDANMLHDKNDYEDTALILSAENGHLEIIKYLIQQSADIHNKNKRKSTALMESAQHGYLACLKFLVEQGGDINHSNADQETALTVSAQAGQLDCIKYLIQQGADLHHKNEHGNTPLLLSVQQGHLDCLKFFVKQGADVNDKNADHNTALILAAKNGDVDCLAYLVEQGAHIYVTNKDKETALLWSAQEGHLDSVKYLVEQGANIHATNSDHQTALLLSAQEDHLDCVKYLVQQGADPTLKDQYDNTPLAWMQEKYEEEVIDDLFSFPKKKEPDKKVLQQWYGAAIEGDSKLLANLYHSYTIKVNDSNADGPPLVLSARGGHIACLKFLLQQGADIQATNQAGHTALLWSAYEGHLACLKYLVQQGADIHSCDKKGYTALLLSAQQGHLDGVTFLVKQGANIDHKDKDHATALLLSATEGHVTCVKYLVEQGADVTSQDKHHNTALHCAGKRGRQDVVNYLTALQQWFEAAQTGDRKALESLHHTYDIHVNTSDKEGNTALLWSAQGGHLACLKFLVEQGANIDHTNEDNDTALLLSAEEGDVDCLKYLVRQRANIHLKDKESYTPALWSAYNGDIDALKFLVQQGADLHDKNKDGDTALLLSAQQGHLNCVKFLVEQGANLHAKNVSGYTAMLLSTGCGHVNCLTYLIQQEPHTHNKNDYEDRALLLGAQEGQLACVKWLHQQGAHINTTNKDKDTALILSAQHGHLACVKYLVQQGADLTWQDNYHRTALQWASVRGGQQGVVNYLSTLVPQAAPFQMVLQQSHGSAIQGPSSLLGTSYHNDPLNVHTHHQDGNTTWRWRAEYTRLTAVAHHIPQGAHSHGSDKESHSALHVSTEQGALDAPQYGAQQETDIRQAGAGNQTSLAFDTAQGRKDVGVNVRPDLVTSTQYYQATELQISATAVVHRHQLPAASISNNSMNVPTSYAGGYNFLQQYAPLFVFVAVAIWLYPKISKLFSYIMQKNLPSST